MKGSKKRAAPSEDVEETSEKPSAKKSRTTPQKGPNQKQKFPDNSHTPVISNDVQSNDIAQNPGAGTSNPSQTTPVASSSREPIVNDDTKLPVSTKPTDAPEKSGPGTKGKAKERPKSHKVRKLAPRRPFPTVPTSVSATGPRSAHSEGKNYICITRKTQLGAYLRRCKELVLKDGYKTIHLHAMGAAITHLARLAVSLPAILPYPKDELHTEIRTGTAEVHDELIPDDEDEDISLRKRDKSTLEVIIRIGDGVDEETGRHKGARQGKSANKGGHTKATGEKKNDPEQVIFQEGDQEDDEMVS